MTAITLVVLLLLIVAMNSKMFTMEHVTAFGGTAGTILFLLAWIWSGRLNRAMEETKELKAKLTKVLLEREWEEQNARWWAIFYRQLLLRK